MGRRVVTRKDVAFNVFGEPHAMPSLKAKYSQTAHYGRSAHRSLRKTKTSARAPDVSEPEQQSKPDDYEMRLVKYIPAEIVAAYITVDGIMQSTSQVPGSVPWLIFFALLILTPLYIWRITTEPGKKPAWAQITVSTFSFAVWVFALGGPFANLSWYLPVYGALLLPVYTVAVPVIVGK